MYPIDGHVEDAKDPTPPPTPYVAPKKTCSGVEWLVKYTNYWKFGLVYEYW